MLTRVDHIDLKVSRFEETIQMFRTMGLEIRREMPERGSVELALPGEQQVVFEIHKAAPGGFQGIHHIAFHTEGEDDIPRIKEGCEVCFSTEHKLIPHTGRTVSSFRDGNGLNWQLTD